MKIIGTGIQVDLIRGMNNKAEPSTKAMESKTQEIMDMLQISENDYSKDLKQYSIQFDELKWKEEFSNDPGRAKEQLLEWTLIGAAKEYAKKRESIDKSGFSTEKQTELINNLDHTYKMAVGDNIKVLVEDYNNYFDRGKTILDQYSEEPTKDLFDEDMFAAHLADMAIKAKNTYLEKGSGSDASEVIGSMNTISSNKVLEKLSYSDLHKSIAYVSQISKKTEVNASGIELGQEIARREQSEISHIDGLGLSRNFRNGLISVQKRISEGMMRSNAYQEEEEYYEKLKEDLYKELQKLLERLRRFDVQMKEIKENGFFDPSNDMLMNVLERRSNTEDEIRRIKKGIDENDESFDSLKENPSTIVNKDSYKKIRTGYEYELNKE